MNTIKWIDPKICYPPHRVFECPKLDDLTESLLIWGWNTTKSPLIGYYDTILPHPCIIQLLSGSHRHQASIRAGLVIIPVIIRSKYDVEDAYGDLDKWAKIMSY